MSLPLILLIAAFGVTIIILIAVALTSPTTSDDVAVRLEEFASRSAPLTLEEIEFSQPFSQRIMLPILKGLASSVTRFTPAHTVEAARRNLEMAGRPNNWGPTEFFGARIAVAILLGVLAFLLTSVTGQAFLIRVGAVILGCVLGYLLPAMWLGGKIRRRRDEILKAMPDALDLLTICVEAGLGFDAAMAKVAEKWDNALSQAFSRVIQEIRLGKLRRHALREMDHTTGVADVTSFVAAVIQADQLGVSMAKVMRIQSEQMRIKRRQRAEEKAHQAPVKMLFPLVFLIFPSIYVVLLGPAMLVVKDSGVMGTM
ncbi:MAG: type II secretion system F family protein [Ardenticatenia bacterium]|nr:type II secretion system F family protein [Ardenticatenia bacterium]